ncbi:MAG TPA: hypothetical protein VM939_03035 [Gemmatimonadaceae bacterium]|nr:hypothetical protein [Gemmatimonadaceae bacterium]
MKTARAYLKGIVDYAGLFPPAGLDFPTAVDNYADYLAGPDADLLGRFVVPASRLHELTIGARNTAGQEELHPWRVSVIADRAIDDVRKLSLEFNCSHWERSELGHAVVDSVEAVVASEVEIERIVRVVPESIEIFLELRRDADVARMVAAIARTRAFAKMRTGGITPDAIPDSAEVIAFLSAAVKHRLPFKATAGLHHVIRSEQNLTYELDSPRAMMHGYLNVLIATALLCANFSSDIAKSALEETDPHAFTFFRDGAQWREYELTNEAVEQARNMMLSFGSCSFREPVDEARALGLL